MSQAILVTRISALSLIEPSTLPLRRRAVDEVCWKMTRSPMTVTEAATCAMACSDLFE